MLAHKGALCHGDSRAYARTHDARSNREMSASLAAAVEAEPVLCLGRPANKYEIGDALTDAAYLAAYAAYQDGTGLYPKDPYVRRIAADHARAQAPAPKPAPAPKSIPMPAPAPKRPAPELLAPERPATIADFLAAAEAAAVTRRVFLSPCEYSDGASAVRTAGEAIAHDRPTSGGRSASSGWALYCRHGWSRAEAEPGWSPERVALRLPHGIYLRDLFRPEVVRRLIALGYRIGDDVTPFTPGSWADDESGLRAAPTEIDAGFVAAVRAIYQHRTPAGTGTQHRLLFWAIADHPGSDDECAEALVEASGGPVVNLGSEDDVAMLALRLAGKRPPPTPAVHSGVFELAE